MPRTLGVIQEVVRDGITPTQVAADTANGHEILNNDGRVVVRINNGNAGTSTWTADIKQQVDGVDPASKSLAVPAGAVRYFGPFPVSIYGAALWLNVDVDTSVTFEIIRIGK